MRIMCKKFHSSERGSDILIRAYMKQKAANNSYHHVGHTWWLDLKFIFNFFENSVINNKSYNHELQYIKENAIEKIFNNEMLETCLVDFLNHANECQTVNAIVYFKFLFSSISS